MPRPSPTLYVLVVIAVPFAWAFETLMRAVLFPPEFAELRDILSPSLVIPGWVLTVLTFLCCAGAFAGHRRALRRLRSTPPGGDEPVAALLRERNAAYVLWTTLAQVPALFGTFVYLFGGPLSATVIAVAVSTGAVILLGRNEPV